jgi:21S rRNA (GM2251-2'-O)-methyltransferase
LEVPQASTPPLFIALSGILDPQNLGSIVRTAHFYDCAGVILPSKESCSLTPIVSKASAGSLEIYGRIFHANSLLKVVKVQKIDSSSIRY